jgi:hypothetical protein
MKQLTTFILISLFFSSCSKKPIIIGDYSCENRVTFEQLRENPEPYLGKEICFEVGRRIVLGSGVDVTSDDDKKLIADYAGQKHLFWERIVEAYAEGDTSHLPDAGKWYIYYNSILPIQMTRYDDRWKSIENKYTIPDEFIDMADFGTFIYNSENTDSLLFSGILFESFQDLTDSAQIAEFRTKYGKALNITRNSVYLTGIKIIPR